MVSHYFPGITPFNVYELTFDWWRRYVAEAREIVAALDKK